MCFTHDWASEFLWCEAKNQSEEHKIISAVDGLARATGRGELGSFVPGRQQTMAGFATAWKLKNKPTMEVQRNFHSVFTFHSLLEG